MSLLLTASPWTNDDSSSKAPRKRQSTMRYQKIQDDIASNEDNDNDIKEGLQNIEPSTIEQSQTINDDRTSKINNLLNHITSISPENDGNKLANYNPPPPPTIINKKNNSDIVLPNELMPHKQPYNNTNNNVIIDSNSNPYKANDSNLGIYSNYKNSYEPSNIQLKPYYTKMGLGNNHNSSDDKLMEKINYMIHLLEEQQNEKTNNVMEEFILYTFLGVFIIYVVDSFARAGKYIR